MKKFLLSSICLSFISSVVCAGRFERILTEGEKVVEMARKSMSTLRVTAGFKPEKQPEIPREFISHREFPRRVQFLDRDHSLFIVPGDKRQSTTSEAPKVTREDDHSVRVDFKKSKTLFIS
ncbi:MAG TPA: hypothetical protein PLY23_06225 [Alphaproteobacteria bacterium]|nr:MAG: hypothetical protein B7X84_05850 [Alphaproteobacteria bacterium 17-39-52]HQS84482.1 hypothetical protein [Alphaproteobacteria bacterium]HQS93667.1 hypothetical protein [Alphaproteobacteria bacterium]